MNTRFFSSRQRRSSSSQAFTLVELMVSVSILVILMLVVSNFIGLVQRTWVRTNSNVSQFREARIAFDIMTRTISQATLNAYWQADTELVATDNLGDKILRGKAFKRVSELQFVCGPSVGSAARALFDAGSAQSFPGHGVFFQAPLGVTRLVYNAGNDQIANTENMVNLLCGRGYFVSWGGDEAFRPAFLESKGVPERFRLRLMEFRPTSDKNPIYAPGYRLEEADNGTGTILNSKNWFRQATDALGRTTSANQQTAQEGSAEDAQSASFTRPVAENILALIISPQIQTIGENNASNPYEIAPDYFYDSTLRGTNLGSNYGEQGTQHLLPPLLRVTMVALDARGGERLSDPNNEDFRNEVITAVTSRFTTAANYQTDLEQLENDLISKRLAYRVFTSTIALKGARWSK